jgi:hypothetical protein
METVCLISYLRGIRRGLGTDDHTEWFCEPLQ